jgi:two-component system, response regulator, stage 0 sporulation protein F
MSNKINLLYVDDEPINLTLFTINFKARYNVFTALDGYKGLGVLKEFPGISIVISDMKMPGINGIEFIKLAKQDFPIITYFILTGFDITEEISEAIETGLIHKYFRKPFDIKAIEKAITDRIAQ